MNPEYVLYKMTQPEIRAVIEDLNDQELTQFQLTRKIAYCAAAPFYDETGKPKKVTIEQFWPLPGDKEQQEIEHNPERDFEIGSKICELMNKQGHEQK